LIDGDHDEVLYERSAHEKRYPASITKVMTALVVLEAIDQGKLALTDQVTAPEAMNADLSIFGSTQDIKVGEIMTVNDLLHCLLITSANEAANILAIQVAGSLSAFVDMMNAKAQALGCKDTHFANCHGLHDDDHYTTAYDIYLFAREAMKYPTFRESVGSKDYVVPATNLHKERTLHSTNALISTWNITGYYYKYAIGIKTGSTPEAGQCLVSSAEKDGKTLYAVVLGAENVKGEDGKILDRQSFSESSRLLEWGFNNFTRQTILDSTYFAGTVPVALSKGENYVGMEVQGELEATLPTGLDVSKFEKKTALNTESLEAPVTKGQVLGSVTVSYDGKEYGTLPLVAVAGVERSELLYRLDQIQKFFDQLWVKLVLLAVILVVLFFLLRWLLFSKRRRYGARGNTKRSGYSGRRRR
ncbi:MAG: D-alanyl-D-alanine carboxypeptidase, partial [Clostridia bacterium]|nr:D-alanyl-D-alanine carboxypeptidase [Clostridia bacterium]